MVLPEGFALPPLPYLLALLVGLGGVVVALARERPAVTDRVVVAFAPWMVAGSAVHVLYVLGVLPASLRPLAGTPSVYASVAVVAGAVWVGANATRHDAATAIAAAGVVAALPPLAAALSIGLHRGTLRLFWPGVGLVVALSIAGATWTALTRLRPAVRVTDGVGVLAVVAHALDGVSTAVGVDVLGFGERTPLSRVIIEFAAGLPTADVVGSTWLFVLVKLALASLLVVWLADYVREDPTEGRLLLGFVAAVGLGPGAHNLILFSVA
ncbi:DUF63 family protein [Haloplanus sp. GCM10025708]|uniref:DUF63 family protein n=1 Tax=Haloferacaceae TaxID=1644056 RepID=UPI003621A1F6